MKVKRRRITRMITQMSLVGNPVTMIEADLAHVSSSAHCFSVLHVEPRTSRFHWLRQRPRSVEAKRVCRSTASRYRNTLLIGF